MTPEERAREIVNRLWLEEDDDEHPSIIASALRTAERDALERAAKCCEETSCFTPVNAPKFLENMRAEIAQSIRDLANREGE